jgi:hypothetical protein
MDPLTAFGLVANIIQLVDFSSKLISEGREIYNSSDGELLDHSELKIVSKDLSRLALQVENASKALGSRRKLSEAEQDQARLGQECHRVASDLLRALDDLKMKGSNRRWNSFRQALLTVWNRDKIERLEKRLDRFRQELVASVLVTLRQAKYCSPPSQQCCLQSEASRRSKSTASKPQSYERSRGLNSVLKALDNPSWIISKIVNNGMKT